MRTVGNASRKSPNWPVKNSQPATAIPSAPTVRTIASPAGPRRTASADQATICAAAVAASTQSMTTSWAAASVPVPPTANAVAPSRNQTCTIHATLSGESSSAPRWSVVGLTGKATAWSREMSSRPPPDAMPDTRLSSRNAARALGITRVTSVIRCSVR